MGERGPGEDSQTFRDVFKTKRFQDEPMQGKQMQKEGTGKTETKMGKGQKSTRGSVDNNGNPFKIKQETTTRTCKISLLIQNRDSILLCSISDHSRDI